MVGAVRFELTTSCSQGRRANQAALRPDYIKKRLDLDIEPRSFGSSGRIRTADKVVNSHPLYQLSYRGLVLSLSITVFDRKNIVGGEYKPRGNWCQQISQPFFSFVPGVNPHPSDNLPVLFFTYGSLENF
jgi:hypothetical protein